VSLIMMNRSQTRWTIWYEPTTT